LSDRYLLTRLRLTLWKHDVELHYRHRPSVRRTIASEPSVEGIVSINRWGHHDTDFPREKPPGEFRALMLGDSVTMGFGVTYDETFSAHLERKLAQNATGYSTFEVINTGVHGYSTYQELRIFEESLAFDPDFVAVGFCLNDITEPFVVSEQYGGVGLDYHGVSQTSTPLVGWLANDTGYGRLLQLLAQKAKSVEAEKRLEIYNVRRMAELSSSDPKIQEAWRITLAHLEAVYDLARESGKPVVLVVFPFTFQLSDESSREPQRILLEHARKHGVPAIDFAPIFERVVFDDPEHLEFLRNRGYSTEDIEKFYKWRIDKYFFDADHFTSEGNAVIAEALLKFLCEQGIVQCKL
jgi:lysophospholipase L1-like esterase